ncbi:hypothetical protein Salmi_Mp110 (mitochondrion) [Salvia miltiorrhiza]|uniref:Uncharacterized protein n=1 Tax=Salvia miltiorrhiza TaxID=226208 RepID=V9P5D8_SALMI|nr:hypothetical protein Salmi_Mp110 [Salvia miltiorrhiza]AGU16638.1 hypothetical protein Salmi_Mp110 [Salvia miltiorrhiza]
MKSSKYKLSKFSESKAYKIRLSESKASRKALRSNQAHKLESSTKTRCSLANCITNWSSAQPVKVSARSESFNRLIKLRQLQHRLNHHRHLQTVKSPLTSFRLVLTLIHHQSQFVHKIVSIKGVASPFP